LNELTYPLQIWYRHGPLLRTNHKMTPKWTWPGSRDRISNFGPPYNFWKCRFKFGREMEDGPSLRTAHKTSSYWRGQGHVTQLLNFGTHLFSNE